MRSLYITHDPPACLVVLKGDLPLSLPLILLLEKKATIITPSVSVSDPAEEIEGKCHGYAHAFGFEPNEVRLVLDSVSTR